MLEVGRINIAARAVGVARAAFDAALAYAQQRETLGKPIGEHQAIQLKLADMATRLEAARLLTKNAAERKAQGLRCDVEAGMAKLFASETALELSIEAMRIHGGVGYTTEFPVERYYRDAPLMVIGEGTNEIQRIVIARGPARPGPRLSGPSPARAASSASTSSVCSPEQRRRRRRPHRDVREAHRAVDRPPRSRRPVDELDETVVGRQLRVVEDLGRALGRRPPHALAVEALGPLVEVRSATISSRTAMTSVRFLRSAAASAKRGSSSRSGRGRAPGSTVVDVAVGLEAGEEEPTAVLGPVRVHERRLVGVPRLGPGHLAQGLLEAEIPPEHVRPGAQQRHLDHAARAGLALLEHGGEEPGQGGQPADVVPDAAAGVERHALAVGQLHRQARAGPEGADVVGGAVPVRRPAGRTRSRCSRRGEDGAPPWPPARARARRARRGAGW